MEIGQWGGRALVAPEALAEDTDPISNRTPEPAETEASLQAWMEKSEASHSWFTVSMLHLVQAILERDNAGLAQEHEQALQGSLPSPPSAATETTCDSRASASATRS